MNTSVLQFSLVFLIVGTLIIVVFKKLKLVISANGKKGMLYMLGMAALFFGAGFLTTENLLGGGFLSNFILLSCIFVLFGILHIVALNKLLTWEEDIKASSEIIFTVILLALGVIFFLNAAALFGPNGFHFHYLATIILFVVPIFFSGMWNVLVTFPVPIYQKWYYPISRNISLPDNDELRNLRIVSLEFNKTLSSPKSVFKAKAPENMNFGKFFYHFINDYNYRTPEAPITYKDENNQPWGWSFYVKPNIFSTTRNIHPEHTILANRIRENTTIICQRVEIKN